MNTIDEIKKVAESGILPDGDHVNISTQMWLEDLILNKDIVPLYDFVRDAMAEWETLLEE